jgi:hypothetical protein
MVSLFGVSRISEAFRVMGNSYSEDYLVPLYNPYYHSYHYLDLPKIDNVRNIHKTICINHSKKQYVNYALRAATRVLLDEQKNNCSVCLVTIYFSREFSLFLSKIKNPVSYYGELIKKRLKKLSVDKFYIVFEEGSNLTISGELSGLHAHIVTITDKNESEALKRALKRDKELLLNKNGKISSSAIKVQFGYYETLLECSSSSLIKTEVTTFETESKWTYKSIEGFNKSDKVFRSKVKNKINIGLADYLSKELSKSIFLKHRNYYISRALNKDLLILTLQVLLNKK